MAPLTRPMSRADLRAWAESVVARRWGYDDDDKQAAPTVLLLLDQTEDAHAALEREALRRWQAGEEMYGHGDDQYLPAGVSEIEYDPAGIDRLHAPLLPAGLYDRIDRAVWATVLRPFRRYRGARPCP